MNELVLVDIINIPDGGGGLDVTDIQYRINGGAPISLGQSTPGKFLTSASIGDEIEIRAVNEAGVVGPWSDIKTADRLSILIQQLYGAGEQGAFYVPHPVVLGEQVLFQDAAGTVPVVDDGDPVGLMLDLSGNGNHASQEVSGARPIYRKGGGKHWLEGDGVSSWMQTAVVMGEALGKKSSVIAWESLSNDAYLAADNDASSINQGLSIFDGSGGTIGLRLTVGNSITRLSQKVFSPRVFQVNIDRDLSTAQSALAFDGETLRASPSVGTADYSTPLTIFRRPNGATFLNAKLFGVLFLSDSSTTLEGDAWDYLATLAGIDLEGA